MASGTSGALGVRHDPLPEVLSGSLGARAIREVTLSPWLHGVAGVTGALTGSAGPGLELLRTKFKPAYKLTAYYRRNRGEHSAASDAEHLAVMWHAPGRAVGADRVSVMVSPADPAMPYLSRLTNPAYLAALVARLDPGHSLAVARLQVRTIRYRPGQRHVLHVSDPDRGRAFVVKTDKDSRGARAVAAARGLRPMLATLCPGADVVEPLGFSALESASLWRVAGETPLSHVIARGDGDAPAAVSLVGQAVRAMHDHARSALDSAAVSLLADHDIAAEAVATLRAGDALRVLLPDVGQQYVELVRAVQLRHSALPQPDRTFLHGDLKSDNLLVDDGRLRILDLDRACLGDAALDLGKFLADLRWWCGGGPAADDLRDAFRTGYGTGAEPRWARAEVVAALYEAKFAARRCPVHDPRWEHLVREQLDRAWATLESAGRST